MGLVLSCGNRFRKCGIYGPLEGDQKAGGAIEIRIKEAPWLELRDGHRAQSRFGWVGMAQEDACRRANRWEVTAKGAKWALIILISPNK